MLLGCVHAGLFHSVHTHRVFLMIYLIRMLFLTLSLGIAARPSLTDPTSYATPLDHFRLVCEIVTLMIILTMIVMEIVNIVEYVEQVNHSILNHKEYTELYCICL